MKIFKRLFGKKMNECFCDEKVKEPIKLLNDTTIKLCSKCNVNANKLNNLFISKNQFDSILDTIAVDSANILDIPLGAKRDEVTKAFPPEVVAQLWGGKISNLMSYSTSISGVEVEIFFRFIKDELNEKNISLICSIEDLVNTLIKRYGIPSEHYKHPGITRPDEYTAIWIKDGYEIQVDYTVFGTLSISYIKKRMTLDDF